ncbi:hypothetical protein B0T09DRAFT_333218 [Sordaria sp. MPI-SDFR-AT-0083]|nr:hypothetical protein B0T09DRAFT_352778 [Sordaria sp. MPI-SDFR-AT-0083]KAH7632194.1 hypothetical protein B0T09DRAFT_337288 [Sordaria sp. MPI-SDFR-AT-0083]KAH7633204.1 hypothetical protein B0T09DRAFT_333218 [Sordaria sp. MPI-SDFR-AT-0083]
MAIAWEMIGLGLLATARTYFGYHQITDRLVVLSRDRRYLSSAHRGSFGLLASRKTYNVFHVILNFFLFISFF